ncbi:MAG: hypothetical protein J6333_08440 [Planctomycetes bacterium]|nr:hypothetical protein [Planctomycetota bacterium]
MDYDPKKIQFLGNAFPKNMTFAGMGQRINGARASKSFTGTAGPTRERARLRERAKQVTCKRLTVRKNVVFHDRNSFAIQWLLAHGNEETHND